MIMGRVFCTVCVIVYIFKGPVHPKIKTHAMKVKEKQGKLSKKKVRYDTYIIFQVFFKPYDFLKESRRNLMLFSENLDILVFLSSTHKSS